MPHSTRDRLVEVLLEPAWRDMTDPIEKIFSLLARYRQLMETAWTDAVLECLIEAGSRLPDALDRFSLAEFVLTIVEGASMKARIFHDVAYFDRAVQELRNYIELLLYGRPSLSFPVRQALADLGSGPPRTDQGK